MAAALLASVCPRCGSAVLAGATGDEAVQLLDPSWPVLAVAQGETHLAVVATAYALHRCRPAFTMG